MDEPTSALSTSECETLFKVVRQLAAAGVAIIYTSHRLDEVSLSPIGSPCCATASAS